jgi:CBS domain-containing protein
MARYRNDLEDDRDRDYYSREAREERLRREQLGAYDEPYSSRSRFEGQQGQQRQQGQQNWQGQSQQDWRQDYNRGSRFGERAEYERDEPRYTEQRGRYGDENRRSSLYDIRGDLSDRWSNESSTGRRSGEYRDRYTERSRLRCRDIMTRDLAVATRDTMVTEVALMMKQEDTGVIPVVEYDVRPGNGTAEEAGRKYEGRNYSRGKLVGLITDRDIVIRGVSEGKDPSTLRAEDIMSVDIHTVHPNDRVVDVIRKMGDKQVRRIPVVNENKYLVGMISMADVAVETREDSELADALEDISKGTSFWNRIFG